MSEAKKCDRCMKFYDKYECNIFWKDITLNVPGNIILPEYLSTRRLSMDLCPDCFDMVVCFLGLKKYVSISDDERRCPECRHKVDQGNGISICDVWECHFEAKDDADAN